MRRNFLPRPGPGPAPAPGPAPRPGPWRGRRRRWDSDGGGEKPPIQTPPFWGGGPEPVPPWVAAVALAWGAPLTVEQIAWLTEQARNVGGMLQPENAARRLATRWPRPAPVVGPAPPFYVPPDKGDTDPPANYVPYDNTAGEGGDENIIPDEAGPSQRQAEDDAAAVNSGADLSGDDGIESWGGSADEDFGVGSLAAILDTKATIFSVRPLDYNGVEMSGRFTNPVLQWEAAALGDASGLYATAGSLWDYLKQEANGAYTVAASAAGKFVEAGSRQVTELRDLLRRFVAAKSDLPKQIAENRRQASAISSYIATAKKRGDNKALAQLTPLRDKVAATGKKLTAAAPANAAATAKIRSAAKQYGLTVDGLGIVPLIPIVAILAVAAVVGLALWKMTSAASDVVKDRQRLDAVKSGFLPASVYGEIGSAGEAANAVFMGFSKQELLVGGLLLGGFYLYTRNKKK